MAYESAAAAWSDLRNGTARPDVVLSDISFQDSFTGVDLAGRVRDQRPDLPVVLMTGYTEQLERAVALDLTVLAKPVGPRELILALKKALGAPARTAVN
jgi:two-component system, NtrC family, sensor kinase